MPKDKLGNRLEAGDLIQVSYSAPSNPAVTVELIGRIENLSEGGVVVPRGQHLGKHQEEVRVTLGHIAVRTDFTLEFDPRTDMLAGIVKVAEPPKGERKTGLLKQ